MRVSNWAGESGSGDGFFTALVCVLGLVWGGQSGCSVNHGFGEVRVGCRVGSGNKGGFLVLVPGGETWYWCSCGWEVGFLFQEGQGQLGGREVKKDDVKA